jgi:ABC-type polysaccharide/polyol phosphate export permease
MAMINLSINILVLLVISLGLGFVPQPLGVAYSLAVLAVLLLMVFTLSQYLSIMLVHVRDLTNIMELIFQLLFWASAVFYGFNDIQGNTGDLIRLNPIAILIDTARNAFIGNQITHVKEMLLIAGITLVLSFIGSKFFNNNIKKISEYF